tara:strand:+ start:262 stop:507 length:246 start_codon:yes stop_codon:yes gene_type:complete
MAYTYTWTDAEQTSLKRECPDSGTCAFVPADPANRDYAEFLSSEATAADYVAPPDPPELTAAEKLANAGLTVDELRTLLDL